METILTRVLDHAAKSPDRLCFHAISRRRGETRRTFGEVARDAERAATFLAAHGVRAGEVVVLIGTHHADLYGAWLGAVWLGAIPTILAEPSVRIDAAIYWSRLRALLERIGARTLLVDPSVKLQLDDWPSTIAHHAYDTVARGVDTPAPPIAAHGPEDLCLLQHSSGTTGLQKGVMLSHGAIMRHGASYQQALKLGPDDVIATWLPLYHDMGMIGCFVMPLLYGVPVMWLSPFEWVANPMLLVEVASQHKATLAWLPNFAYLFLAQRARPQGIEAYDLSSLRAVINCSEPITEGAMAAFADKFAAARFSRAALHTSYAMAENIFAVTQSTPEEPPRTMHVDGAAWRDAHRAVRVERDSPGALTFVSSGVVVPDCRLKIVDESGAELPALSAGRVLIRSTFLFDGYFADARGDYFDAEGFYDTGDLGFVDADGHVFVTGRRKDLVIVGGKNVYPQDVEQAVAAVEGVYPGRVVCFGVGVRELGTEGLVVLVESELPEDTWPELARRIQRAVPAALDVDLVEARVIRRQELRKSTSGKLARGGNREWYLAGKFGPIPARIATEGGTT
ncbi:AMP-binding protein [Myxococcota bacterium]|nr:AMP-binding protein [Myxococcota bacterium]